MTDRSTGEIAVSAESLVVELEARFALARDSVGYTKEYGLAVLRGCFLVNGGAMVALLALIGSIYAARPSAGAALASDLVASFWCFASGLALVLAAMACGYFNFFFSASLLGAFGEIRRAILHGAPQDQKRWARLAWRMKLTTMGATVLTLASGLAFIGGAAWAGKVIIDNRLSVEHAANVADDNRCRTVMGLDGRFYHKLFCPLDTKPN